MLQFQIINFPFQINDYFQNLTLIFILINNVNSEKC